ncbi:MAG: hypothetical protein K2N05_10840 [Muribaculaceae bacterium]|nr:hypothetical protein [Muribaculaceae bacterium]
MKVDRNLLEILKEHVAIKFGHNPKTPTDFNLLAQDIYTRTKRTIGVSTLKRIWGYISASHGTSFSSLSHLSRYIGYGDWDSFCSKMEKKLSEYETSGFNSDTIIVSASLQVDTEIYLEWPGRKRCKIKKIKEPDIFRIIESENIKLFPEDTGKIESIVLGKPLVMIACKRDGKNLGTYTGATKEGITSITFVSE